MKKLWTLSVLVMCAALAMAQFAHAGTAENTNCDVVKSEQHIQSAVEKVSSIQNEGDKAAQENCCESCHLQLISLPEIAVDRTAPEGEPMAAVPASPRGIFLDTLSEPPQA